MRGAAALEDERLAHLENLSDARWQKQQEGDKSVTPTPRADAPQVPAPETKERMASDRDAARLFLHAYHTDSLNAWIQAVGQWNERPYRGKIGEAVRAMRAAFYHDGSVAARLQLKGAVVRLRRATKPPPLGVDAETRSASAPSHDSSVESEKTTLSD